MRRNKPIAVVKCYDSEKGIFARSNEKVLYEKHSNTFCNITKQQYGICSKS